MPLSISVTVQVIAQKDTQIPHTSNHSQVRDLRSEGTHFKNKYKFMILKIFMMPK